MTDESVTEGFNLALNDYDSSGGGQYVNPYIPGTAGYSGYQDGWRACRDRETGRASHRARVMALDLLERLAAAMDLYPDHPTTKALRKGTEHGN